MDKQSAIAMVNGHLGHRLLDKRNTSFAHINSATGGIIRIETEQETDGRWIAEAPEIPGALVYGSTPEEAIAKAQALALRVLADRIEHGESDQALISSWFQAV